jgi:hypothetical protein
MEIRSLHLSPLWCTYSTPPPLLCVSFQFLVYSSFFLWGGESVCPGVYAGLSLELLGEYWVTLGAHLFVCQMSPKQVCSRCLAAQEPSCFLRVMWHGEAFHGLGVQSVEILILLGALFLPSVTPASQQYFWFVELILSASLP